MLRPPRQLRSALTTTLAVLLLPIVLPVLMAAPLAAQDPAESAAGSPPREIPADHRSPRATMTSFLEAFYQEGGMERAVAALDLSEVPEDLRPVKGPELAVQLKEVLDRTRLIEPEEIPDEPDAAPYVVLSRPEGDVVIDRNEAGEWRFTAETVDRVPGLFHAVEGQAVVAGLDEDARIGEVARADVSPGFWLRSKVPRSLRRTAFILEAWQWLGLLALALLGIVVDRLVVLLAEVLTGRWLRRRVDQVEATDLHKALRPLGIVAMAVLWRLLLPFLWLPVNVLAALTVAVRFVIAAGAVWAAYRLVDILSAVLEARAARSHNRFDDLLVPLVRKSLKVFIAAFGVVFVADTLDIEISSLLAGLGIGGLAVALAAQDAIKNLFGSLTVLLDRPFSVGDWVVIGDVEGTVEEVGFRSIRVRTFYNSLITLPNANLISASVDNYGARRYRRWSTKLAVAYDTPPERIEAFCEGIRELVRRHPHMRKDYFHVYLNGFGESALEVLLYVFFEVPDWSVELEARHRLANDILRLADALGVELAVPSRTVFLHRATRGEEDDSRPELDGDAAEAGRRAAAALAGADPSATA
jgi:MscS family membrane protein